MKGIAKLFKYTMYVEQQRNSSTEELNRAVEEWDKKPLPAKLLSYYTSVFTGKDAELQAMAARNILEEREAYKGSLAKAL